MIVIILLFLFGLIVSKSVNAAPAISAVSDNRASYPGSTIPRYAKLEISSQITTTATRLQWPYDPNPPVGVTAGTGISVNAIFTSPSGQTFTQPAFYNQPHTYQAINGQDWLYPVGSPTWTVRFAPNQTGTWSYRLNAQDATGTSQSLSQSFTVTTSSSRGFVRVSTNDTRYFEFDDGTYFPALGYNMNWNHISWDNPVIANQTNFSVMGQNGIQLIRLWLSEWSVYGTNWNPWRCILNGCSAQWTEVKNDAAYTDHDVAITMYAGYNACMSSGHWLSPPIAVKPNTQYRIRSRVKTEGITGPRIAGQPYGFVAKITDNGVSWLQGSGTNCQDPGVGKTVTSYLGNSDWTEITGTYTSPNINFLSSFYLTLTNVNDGVAYVDSVVMEEILGTNTYGPNIIIKPGMNHHQYVDHNLAARFDKVVELAQINGVYLRPVILEWQDDVLNMIDSSGFYGNWRQIRSSRWYQNMWYRYLQARWGYSTAIHSWELVNEGDPNNGNLYAMADEFGKEIKCRVFGQALPREDGVKCQPASPNYHLTSTSFWTDYPKNGFWENPVYPNMDFADFHRYAFRNGTENWLAIDGTRSYVAQSDPNFFDTALMTQEMSQVIHNANPHMPVIRGETGIIENNDTNAYTSALDGDIFGTATNQGQGIWLHNFVWGHINPGGLIESYWYENYSGRHIYGQKDQRGHFGTYYKFISTIPLSNGHYADVAATTNNTNIRAWGQKDTTNKQAHLWIQNKNHTWNNYNPAAQSGTVTISGFTANTAYTVQWWDTYTGVPAPNETITANATGAIVLTVSNLVTDKAVKILPSGQIPTPTRTPTSVPSPSVPAKQGDANGDNRVDGLDYVIWLNHYGGVSTGVTSGDFNADNRIDGLDYVIWLNNYGR